MNANEVAYGTQQVHISGGNSRYTRINTSTNVIPRNSDEAVFVNTTTGRIRIVANGAACTPA